MEAQVYERRVRRDGEPARCDVCGALCPPSMFGPVRCREHTPQRPSHHTGRPAGTISRQARHQAKQRAKRRAEVPLAVAIPVAAPPPPNATDRPRTLRERLQARREAAERGTA